MQAQADDNSLLSQSIILSTASATGQSLWKVNCWE